MADRFDSATRSYIMSRIRGKWTAPERLLHNQLKGMKVRHTMHPKMFGSPDAFLKDYNTVVFIDGCFWHGCPEHCHMPKTRRKFWKAKIGHNIKRDKVYTVQLKKLGYNVTRIWECELNDWICVKCWRRLQKEYVAPLK
jgi:DNA mismatch endonuclease (patch repair protein)